MEEHKRNRLRLARELMRIGLPIGILALGIGGFVVFSRQGEAPARVVEEEQPPLVETVPAEAHDRGLELEIDGVVVPYREIELAAEVEGRIAEKTGVCRAGSYVKRGDLLLRIDPEDYQLEVDRLTKELAQAEAAWRESDVETKNTESLIKLAERQLELQEKSYQRERNLHTDGVAADSELDLALQNKLQAENGLMTLRNQLRLLKEREGRLKTAIELAGVLLKKADLSLSRTEIRCPGDTDGVVVSDLVEKDDYVRKGTPLVAIEDTSKVEVKCSLRVDELFWLWNQTGLGPGASQVESPEVGYQIPRAPVTVVYRLAGRDYEWNGELSRYEGIGLDESTRTVPCRVVVTDPRDVCVAEADGQRERCTGPPALLRGMFVTVRIHVEPQAEMVRISEAAIRPGNRVWVVRDGKLAALDVRVVRVTDEVAILLAGELKAGDRVVVTPLASAVDGMTVREQAVR